MENLMEWLLAGAVGLMLGVLIDRLTLRDRLADARRLSRCEQELREERETSARAGARAAGLQASLDSQQERIRDQERFHRETMGELEQRFKALSHDALQQNSRNFLEVATQVLEKQTVSSAHLLDEKEKNIGTMLGPVREQLGEVARRMQEVEKGHADAYGAVTARITDMLQSQGELRQETANLVKALRAPQTRGRWGEIQLRRVVEMAGMVEHCDFTQQVSVTDGEGQILRPDMLVRLPGEKSIVVDAKTPLYAYLEALEARDEETRVSRLKEHARQVKTHIGQLGAKSYWAQFDEAPDFVVLFLPGDAFYSAAMEQDPELLEYGVSRNVILATPTTLIALLRAVAYGWQQASLARDAREISRLGRELYERLGVLTGHFAELRKGLQRSVEAYNRAVRSYDSRVLVTARKFEELGLSRGETMDPPETVAGLPREAPGEE